jgi:hypothetical protein
MEITNGGLHLAFHKLRLSELLDNISKKKVSIVKDDLDMKKPPTLNRYMRYQSQGSAVEHV